MAEASLDDAAILLMAMGADAAAEVFKQLSPKEVQAIGEVMANLRTTSNERVEQVLNKFHGEASTMRSLVDDSDQYVRDVLSRALGEDKAGMLLDRILQGGDVSGIESLKWMDADSIAELIRNEHPQIIASILVHLERDHAAAILSKFTDRLRADCLMRIATLDGIQPSALRELNEVLTKVLAGGDRIRKTALGGVKPVAEIMNFIPGSMETEIMELAQKIADNMFTFDDLLKLDDKAIQTLLREVQSEQLVVSLKGATGELREKVFKNMSSRAAETLREDLESRGPMRLSDVEAEQKNIMKTVRKLADDGQIALNSGGGGDDAFV
jgi:flagellar motor switch protein FliG